MLRAGHIEQMGTGIKKMRDLVKKEGLPPIKFKFTNFTTATFYRPPYPLGSSIELSKSDINFSEKLSKVFGIKGAKIKELLQILHHIEKDIFSKLSFSKNYNVASRTLDRNITLLKKHKLISFEDFKKAGRYKITEKYKKIKKS